MRYWVAGALGAALFLGSVVVFNLKLVELLDTGTCASGGPYEIARPCPEGTGLDIFLLVGSIFGLFISAGVFLGRGEPPPGHKPSGFAWPLLAWGIFFAGTGAVALYHSLTADVPSDAELGGIIVGVTFLIMGVPALIFLVTGVGSGYRTRETRMYAKRAASRPIDADSLSKLERLESLRASGTLSRGEFESEKAKILNDRS